MIGTSSILRTIPKTAALAKQTAAKAYFSSECAPALKLQQIFEQYRQEHFSRELPSRFRKEMVKIIEGPDHLVAVDNFNLILSNIGRSDASLSESEMNDLLMAAGSSSRKIPVEQAMMLL
ncbi:expressed unknown protein [Seminavis robusta]|uniref:Uncharacterized protein n=1 Tax=Seminavis robusta TaxID=568900 RepID=A0A9N8HNI7_9STRA|nr:expressed unknown protein [Seminavis robusta]|eukprot:Sro989_g228540.1 n/a (120) ;mRNA; r:34809-35168